MTHSHGVFCCYVQKSIDTIEDGSEDTSVLAFEISKEIITVLNFLSSFYCKTSVSEACYYWVFVYGLIKTGADTS